MEILGKLFDSPARVKILRLFLFNTDEVYENKEVAQRARVMLPTVRREISMLSHIGFVKKRTCYKDVEKKKGGETTRVKKKISGWTLDPKFPYREALQSFLVAATPLNNTEVLKRLNKTGTLRLIIVAGVFIQNWDSRLDILIVGSKINQPQLKAIMKDMEAELGKELQYALFSTSDFKYRLSVYDKLIRDVLDYPHEVLVDRIGVS